MLNTYTIDLGVVTKTLIAGTAFDARHAMQIRQTARIYSYTRRIRRLAADAAPEATPLAPTKIVRPPVYRQLSPHRGHGSFVR